MYRGYPEAVYYMRDYNVLYKNNAVRDYNVAQGVSNPADLSLQIIRDISIRYVTVENSSPFATIGISVAESPEIFPVPPIKFTLKPGEIRHLGINTIGEQMQFIHMIDLETNTHLGTPYPFRTNANQFVLRQGINKWFVDGFHRPSFNAAH